MDKALQDALALEYAAKLNNFGYSVTQDYVRGVIDAAVHGTSKTSPAGGPAMFIYKWVKEAGLK